jgi:hypothetical protein
LLRLTQGTDNFAVYKSAYEALPLIQDDDFPRSSELAVGDWDLDAADDALGEASDQTEPSDDELGP